MLCTLYSCTRDVKDAELLNTCVNFGWDTDAEEVTLLISKEDGTVIYKVERTTDYFQPLFSADWLKEIDRTENLIATVSNISSQIFSASFQSEHAM